MSQKYFDNLPNVLWSNTEVKHLGRRVDLTKTAKKSSFIFYPYEISHNLRADQVADYYYDDPYLDWFIYHSNQVIDPYYHWYLNDYQLERLLVEKYGSVERSQKLIRYFINNWESDPNQISVAEYTNVIAPSWKKYYTPIFANQRILAYERRQDYYSINTNRLIQYTISANNSSVGFANDELVDIKVAGGSSATVGTGQVVRSNSSAVIIQHCLGNTSANGTHQKLIVGETTTANVTANAANTIVENVTEEEEVFWSPYTFYEYEIEQNENRKNIKLVDANLKDLLVNQFFQKMQEDSDPLTNLIDES